MKEKNTLALTEPRYYFAFDLFVIVCRALF